MKDLIYEKMALDNYALLDRVTAQQRETGEIFDNLTDILLQCDDHLLIRYANRAWEQQLGHRCSESTGTSLLDYVEASDLTAFLKEYNRFTSGARGNVRLIGADHKAHHFQYQFARTGQDKYFLVLKNTTEIMQTRSRLQRLYDVLFKVFMESPTGILTIDTSGNVFNTNSAFERMTGIHIQPSTSLVRVLTLLAGRYQDVSDLRHSIQHEAGLEPFEDLLLSGENGIACIQLDKQGNPGYLFCKQIGFPGAGSDPSDMLGINRIVYFQDITEAYHVDRLRTDFMTTAAHELRTPLTSIYGYSELLYTQELDAETQSEIFHDLYEQSRFVNQLVNNFFDIAKIDAGLGDAFSFEQIDLREFVNSVASGFPALPGRKALELINALPDRITLLCDPTSLRRALNNLLQNAYNHNQDAVQVRLHARLNGKDCRDGVSLVVEDDGNGMTETEVRNIYEKFWTNNKSGVNGTGLGMYYVKKIVDLHDARIDVESQPGKGTRVCISFHGCIDGTGA